MTHHVRVAKYDDRIYIQVSSEAPYVATSNPLSGTGPDDGAEVPLCARQGLRASAPAPLLRHGVPQAAASALPLKARDSGST